MKKISIGDHVLLTENILKTLAQNHITTISEFLQEDVEKLSIISTLSMQEILEIRTNILLKFSAPLVDIATLWSKNKNRILFTTSIQSLDEALEGGIPVGSITELCGLAGSGKTQLCLQLAVNCAKSNYSVLYIDSKGDFSALRVMKILDLNQCNHKQMAEIMSKIQVVHIWTLKDAVELLQSIKTGIIDNLGLLIIDSLPSLMFQHLGDDNKIGLTMLNELVNNVRFVSKELRVAVVCVNIHTRWLDNDISDIDDDEESNFVIKTSHIEKLNRCLGKYWQHIPSTLLVIEKCDNIEHDNTNFHSIQVNIQNCRLPKQNQHCILKLDDLGISTI